MEDALLDGVSSNNIRAVVQLLQSGHVSVSCRARTSGLTPLQIAAREGYHQLVRVLLEHKANVNSLHHATRLNALHYAVAEDRVMACEAILSFCRQTESTKHLHDLLHQQAARGMAAIHMACARGSVPLVELLLQYNASLNAPDARKLRPLHHAVIERHAPVAELLIDRGASLDAVDKHRMSPLLYAVMNHDLPLTTLLLERRCQVNLPDRRMQTPLMRAAKDGHFDLASLLLEYMADPCPKLPEPERDPDPDSSVLLLAVRANQLDFVRALLVRYQLLPLHAVVFLDDGRVVVNTPPKLLLPSATTDTSTSSTADHSDVPTQSLQSLQSPPQPTDSTTQSTLRAELDRATKTAIRLGFFDVAKVLLASRDDLDAAKLDDLQCRIAATPHSTTSAALLSNLLYWNAEPSARALVVAYANNYCCVNSLLHAKVSIHGTNSRGETPLHIAASHSDPSTALLSSLLLSGADLNAKTNSGRQPIHYVRELAHLKLLLEYSANINARDNDNRTLLLTNTDMYSCENLELLSAILEAKALPHVYSPAKDVCSTPMHVAAHCGSIESVRVLLAADANVNARNVDDATPLHLAVARYRDDYTLPKHIAQERSVDLVKLLLDARAFVNAIDRARWTPLHCAVSTRFDNEQVVNVLLEYGANTAMVCAGRNNQKGGTPQQLVQAALSKTRRRHELQCYIDLLKAAPQRSYCWSLAQMINAPDRVRETAKVLALLRLQSHSVWYLIPNELLFIILELLFPASITTVNQSDLSDEE